MKKFKLEIEETRTFRHTVVVEAESEEKLDEILNDIESKSLLGFSDYEFYLGEENGCNIVQSSEDLDGDLNSIECTDID